MNRMFSRGGKPQGTLTQARADQVPATTQAAKEGTKSPRGSVFLQTPKG
jgi:hypothetical protein